MASPIEEYRKKFGKQTQEPSAIQIFRQQKGLGGNISSKDLKTVSGLEKRAAQIGVSKQAKKITESYGEDPEKIFSGGFITDVFDVLNATQHGVVGILKGKSFREGMQTRESFSKKDAYALSDDATLRILGGTALDIAVDPMTYVPILGLGKAVLRTAGAAAKIAGKTATKLPLIGNSVKQTGDILGRALVYRYGQDPIYQKIAEKSQKAIGIGIQNVLDIVRPITKLDSAAQIAIGNARKAGNLESLTPDILEKAKPAFAELDRLGREAVDVGLLDEQTYFANMGKYMARLYKSKEIPEEGILKTIFDKKPQRIELDRFKKRKDIPEDIRESMGEILEAGYPTAKSLIQLKQSIEKAKFFKEVNGQWGKLAEEITPDIADGMKKLPDTKSLGALSGKFVPGPIFDDLQELTRKPPEGLDKYIKKAVATFKYSKVVLNPATHIRNIISNFILNDFAGLSPARLDIYGKAASELIKKGNIYKEAKNAGLAIDTFAAQELKDILGGKNGAIGGLKNIGDKIANLYQKEEEFAKLAQFIYQREKGLSPEDAVKAAEMATFNYAQVTPFIRRVRESAFGVPFITFTYKATPQVIKTMITKPGKVSYLGKIKNSIEKQTGIEQLQQERANEPSWVKDGLYVRLPGEDKLGRARYLDLTYVLPFGDIVAGNYFERPKTKEGLPESVAGTVASKLAFVNILREIWLNKDFSGKQIYKKTDDPDKQTMDMAKYVLKTFAPPIISDAIPTGYEENGTPTPSKFEKISGGTLEQQREYGRRTTDQEIMRYFGYKIDPLDLEKQMGYTEKNKVKALQTLLDEKGGIQMYQSPFIPED